MSKRNRKRQFGILMPIASLPSNMEIGSLGKPAYQFVDWLKSAGQHYWQILPVTHADGTSPYTAFSAFAGNPNLIDLNLLKEGLIKKVPTTGRYNSQIQYDWVEKNHMEALREAYSNLPERMRFEFSEFKKSNSWWLRDYAFFMAYRDYNNGKPLSEMDPALKARNKETMEYYGELLKREIEFYAFVQYLFFDQWVKLKRYANSNGIEIVGDMPIYVSANSADVWANPKLFKVNNDLIATGMAGCPPDPYSETGQLWGNPVYDWDYHYETGYDWWIRRIIYSLNMVNVLRIDHFRAFDQYWEIPEKSETAIGGKWMPGPGMKLFKKLNEIAPGARIIAEDLGTIDDGVRNLLKETGFPGMKVMIFGITDNNEHTPENWKENIIGYTSTHDSEPIKAAFEALENKDKYLKLFGIDVNKESIGLGAVRVAYESKANTVISPIADVLSYGAEARINVPGVVGPENWSWRSRKDMFSSYLAQQLKELVERYEW